MSEGAKYYLQDSRTIVGNYLVFWRKECCGYTTDIDEAEEFTLKEALSHRDTDIPWPVEEMRAKARPRVDHQTLMYEYAEQRKRMVKLAKDTP